MWIMAGDTTILQCLPSLELYIVGVISSIEKEKWEVVEWRGRMICEMAEWWLSDRNISWRRRGEMHEIEPSGGGPGSGKGGWTGQGPPTQFVKL